MSAWDESHLHSRFDLRSICNSELFLRRTRTHGTKCASVAAGVNNTFCGTGVAFRAQIAGRNTRFKNTTIIVRINVHVMELKYF